MPFVNDPNKPGQFDLSKMTGEEMEAYGKVKAHEFLLLEAVKKLSELHAGSERLVGQCED